MNAEPATKVIFRLWHRCADQIPWGGADRVIALFPREPGTYDWSTMCCYEHVGQHGSASREVIGRTRLATPAEYAALRRELKSIGYRLTIGSRVTRADDDARRKALEPTT